MKLLNRINISDIILYRYRDCEQDLKSLIEKGDVIHLRKAENDKSSLIFHRGCHFQTELSGKVNVRKGDIYIETTLDSRDEIRRGDAIYINNIMYRVNADTTSTNKKLYSLTSVTDMNKTLQEKEKYFFIVFF